MIVSGGGFLLPSSRVRGGMVLDEIDTYIYRTIPRSRYDLMETRHKRVTVLRGFLSTIYLTTTRLCRARGRLVLQVQFVEFSGEA